MNIKKILAIPAFLSVFSLGQNLLSFTADSSVDLTKLTLVEERDMKATLAHSANSDEHGEHGEHGRYWRYGEYGRYWRYGEHGRFWRFGRWVRWTNDSLGIGNSEKIPLPQKTLTSL